MRQIAVIDAETDPFKIGRIPKPFLWGFYNGNNFLSFEKTAELINFLSDKEYIIYAHNGGKFDYHFFAPYIENFSEILIINGRISKFKIGKCEFRDSYNILPIPLSAYQKTEINYNIFEKEYRDIPENKKIITEYLKDDCVFTYDMIKQFRDTYGTKITLASSALDYWAKKFNNKKSETDKNWYNKFYPYYFGGRVENFFTGEIKNDFYVVDINSAYPFAMIHEHPYGEYFSVDTKLPKTESEIKKSFISLSCVENGMFPIRTKIGLSFPISDNITEYNITGWEYLTAQKLNLLKNVTIKKVITFEKTINFKEYVDEFYEKKKFYKGKDKAQYIFSKLFLNSLYGKFGANPSKYKKYIMVDAKFTKYMELDNNDYTLCGLFGEEKSVFEKPLPEDEQHYYNIVVAASITGFVRAYLAEAKSKAKNIYYCDTDCLVCEDYGDINIGPELGQWELEAHCIYGAIAGKKLYAFKKIDGSWKTATKGVKLSPDEIISVSRGKEVTYYPENPTFSVKKSPVFTERKIKINKKEKKHPLNFLDIVKTRLNGISIYINKNLWQDYEKMTEKHKFLFTKNKINKNGNENIHLDCIADEYGYTEKEFLNHLNTDNKNAEDIYKEYFSEYENYLKNVDI